MWKPITKGQSEAEKLEHSVPATNKTKIKGHMFIPKRPNTKLHNGTKSLPKTRHRFHLQKQLKAAAATNCTSETGTSPQNLTSIADGLMNSWGTVKFHQREGGRSNWNPKEVIFDCRPKFPPRSSKELPPATESPRRNQQTTAFHTRLPNQEKVTS